MICPGSREESVADSGLQPGDFQATRMNLKGNCILSHNPGCGNVCINCKSIWEFLRGKKRTA